MTTSTAAATRPTDMTSMLAALEDGRTTPNMLVDRAIDRAKAANAQLNCIALPIFERAQRRAHTVGKGALRGVPTMIKDNLAEQGLPLAIGSAALRSWITPDDAPYTQAIAAAGLISIARSTMPELGMNAATESPLVGITRNPWNLDHTPGGSSGGGAAAVAAGIVPVAHATDGLGSIRHGASPCGLVGLKPSRGRNIGEEANTALTDISVNGCVARTVRDAAAWFAATQSRRSDAPFAPLMHETHLNGALRVRFYDTVMRTGSAPDASVSRVFGETRRLLERLGHQVSEGRLPFDRATAASALNDFVEGRFAREFDRLCTELVDIFRPDDLEHRSKTLVAAGKRIDDRQYEATLCQIDENANAYLAAFETFDIWMTPTVSCEVPLVGVLSADIAWEDQRDRLLDYAGYCWIDNFAGTPAITLPVGFSDNGLPVGVQFATRPGGEGLLLALARQLEDEIEWWRHTPPIWVGDD